MAHKGLRQLASDESASLTYDQAGFDLMFTDHNIVAGENNKIFVAKAGTNTANVYHQDVPTNDIAHWVGIHNCGTALAETCSVQAVSIDGDDFAKDGTYAAGTVANYIEILPGDIVYGKFTQVSLVITSSGSPVAYIDTLRLIRGV